MRKFTDLIKAVLIIALVIILVGATAKLFVPAEDPEPAEPDDSVVDTLPDASEPDDSVVDTLPDASEPEESEPEEEPKPDFEYLDITLDAALADVKGLVVRKYDDGSLGIEGITSGTTVNGAINNGEITYVLLGNIQVDKYDSSDFVLSYEVVRQFDDHDFTLSLCIGTQDENFVLTEEYKAYSFEDFDLSSGIPVYVYIESAYPGDYLQNTVIRFKIATSPDVIAAAAVAETVE